MRKFPPWIDRLKFYPVQPRIYTHLQQAFIAQQHLTETGLTIILSASEERFFSYQDLYRLAIRMLGALQDKGLRQGDELIIQTNNNDTFLVLFWAAILGGIVPVPLHFAAGDELKLKLANVLQVLRNPVVMIEEDHKYGIQSYLLDRESPLIDAQRVLLTEQLAMDNQPGQLATVTDADVAFIQFSSGSTGSPKGILLTHKNLCTNVYDIIDGADVRPTDVSITWMPYTHDMGLIGMHLTPLFLGVQVFNIPVALFIRQPLLWVQKIHEHRITTTQSPNFGYSFVMSAMKRNTAYQWDLSSVHTIFNGAEPISPVICRQFLDTFAPYGLKPSSMFTVYGLAEATLAVCFPQPFHPFKSWLFKRSALQLGLPAELAAHDDDDPIEMVVEGKPLPSVRVRICNDADEILPAGCVGHIQVHGAAVSPGYYGDSGRDHFTADGWLKSGDLGCFFAGELVVTGRAKELIIVNGQNFYPHDLEAKLCTVLDIALGKIAVSSLRTAETEKLLVFVQFRKNLADFMPIFEKTLDLMTALTGTLDCVALPVNNVPKTTSGKIQRVKLADLYRTGHFQTEESTLTALADLVVIPWQTDDPTALQAQITGFLAEEIGKLLPAYAADDFQRPLMELGITSKQMILLTGKLSRTLGIELNSNMYFSYPTLSLLAGYLTGLKLGYVPDEAPRDELRERIARLSDDEIAALLEADDF